MKTGKEFCKLAATLAMCFATAIASAAGTSYYYNTIQPMMDKKNEKRIVGFYRCD